MMLAAMCIPRRVRQILQSADVRPLRADFCRADSITMPVTTLPERTMWTLADVEALPDDGNRYEILHGELLVTPLPSVTHDSAVATLLDHLAQWCNEHTGWAVSARGGIYVGETNWFEPDVCVFPAPRHSTVSWREMPKPVLVIEILSPSTTKRDRHRKRPAYL